jgi:hypothetical protein
VCRPLVDVTGRAAQEPFDVAKYLSRTLGDRGGVPRGGR